MKGILSIILFFTFFSCTTQKEVYVDNPHTLRFGSAGGFTNQTLVFKLLSDGKLWKSDGLEKEPVFLKQLKKSQTKKIFNQTYQLGLDTLNLNSPGNMNNFIQLKTKNLDNKIVWAKDSKQASPEVIDFYKTLINYSKP